MSFSRAFSTRRQKSSEIEISVPLIIGRAASQRGGKPVPRQQISSPMALVSTSNAHVMKAHNIAGTSPIEIRHVSSGSTSSSDESDASHGSSVRTLETVTDASSVDESPIATEPEPNHLTSYFNPSVDTRKHSKQSQSISSRPSLDQAIPFRALSHSKKAHEGLHRKRSIQRMLSPPPPRERVCSTEIFNPNRAGLVEEPKANQSPFVEALRDNPFGNELAQLDRVAEEFGQVVRSAEADADAVYMESHGLAHFSASDYMFEIQSLIHEMFSDERRIVYDLGNFF